MLKLERPENERAWCQISGSGARMMYPTSGISALGRN